MRKIVGLIGVVVSAVIAIVGYRANLGDEFEERRAKTYDHLPAVIPSNAWGVFTLAGGRFGGFYKDNVAELRPHLRDALRKPGQSPWFLFDGAAMMHGTAESDADRQLAADALAGAPVTEMNAGLVAGLALLLTEEGADTEAVALHLLDAPEMKKMFSSDGAPLLPEHYAQLCFVAQPGEGWVTQLIDRLDVETDAVRRRRMVTCLELAVSPEADAVVEQIASDPEEITAVRMRARHLVLSRSPPTARDGSRRVKRDDLEAAISRAYSDGRLHDSCYRPGFLANSCAVVEAGDERMLRSLRRNLALSPTSVALRDVSVLTRWLRACVAAQEE